MNTVSDEVERCTALHDDRRARMMRQHEHVGVIRRRVPPPALPLVIRPVAANWTEHIAAEDPGAYVLETAGHKIIVDARRPLTVSNTRWKACVFVIHPWSARPPRPKGLSRS